MRKLGVDMVDEHYYKSPEWFLSNASRYDKYDRKVLRYLPASMQLMPSTKLTLGRLRFQRLPS